MNPFKRSNPTPNDPAQAQSSADDLSPSSREVPLPTDPDQTAALIDQLQGEINRLVGERDDARHAHKLALAEFQNYQRRAISNEQAARDAGVRNVLYAVMPVIDHFDMALLQNPETVSAGQVMRGVALIKDELLRAFTSLGVTLVNPARNDPFDASKHEAIMQQPGEGVEPGHVALCLRVGFLLNDRLVRPAQVAVAPAAS